MLNVIQVLKKYPDKPLAQEMLAELESYAGDPAHILMSRESLTATRIFDFKLKLCQELCREAQTPPGQVLQK